MAQPAKKLETKKKLAELTKEWARAKATEELAAREAEAKRREILEDPLAKPGYRDESLVISETKRIDTEDEALLQVLRREKVLEQCFDRFLSVKKLHAVAALNPKVAAALEHATNKTPRFEQACKKAP